MRTIYRQPPFTAEIAFRPAFGIRRNNGYEQRTIPHLLADLVIPRIPAPQFALVEPDLDASGAQCIANTPSGLDVLRGIA